MARGYRSNTLSPKSRAVAVSALLAAVTLSVRRAPAAENDYISTSSGNWNVAASWSLGHVPLAGEDPVIGLHSALTTDLTVTLDVSTPQLTTLTLDSKGLSGYAILNQSSNFQMTAQVEYLGMASVDNRYNQSNGVNLVSNAIYIGCDTQRNEYNLSGSGSLEAENVFLGWADNSGGTLTQTGGSAYVDTGLTIGTPMGGGSGVYNLSAGSLWADTIILSGSGTFNQTGGSLDFTTFDQRSGTIANGLTVPIGRTYSYSGGTFTGRLINRGVVDFQWSFTASNGMLNASTLTINPGTRVTVLTFNGAGLDNEGTFNLNDTGITLAGNGPIINNGHMSITGTIATTGGLVNYGLLEQSPNGPIILTQNATTYNDGTFNLAAGQQLQVQTSHVLVNNGTLNLDNAIATGVGGINNALGVILGPGTIATSTFSNSGNLQPGKGTLYIPGTWTNGSTGLVELTDATSQISGGTIGNFGTIQGFGTVSSTVIGNPLSTIEAIGGTLALRGGVTNSPGAVLAASTGNKLLVTGGFPTNAGLISLAGGTFDTNGWMLTNTGQITGYGILRTGGLVNNGTITLTGTGGSGTTTVNGDVTNTNGHALNIKFNPAIFTGNVVNQAGATMKTTSTTVAYGGTFTNSGSYISDPSTNIFQSGVTIAGSGSMIGGAGDVYNFSTGTFTNNGTFSNGGTLVSSDPFTNTGTFAQSGLQSWSGGTTFTNTGSGTATFASDAGSVSSSPLSMTVNGGSVHFTAAQHLAALAVSGGALAFDLLTPGTSTVIAHVAGNNGLTLSGGSIGFPIHSTGAASLGYYKIIQYSGAIQGSGISSLSLPVDDANGIAYRLYTSKDASFVDVHRGLLGDANDDGLVNFSDFVVLSNHFGLSSQGWNGADFNNDGLTNFSDFVILSNHFGATIGSNEAAIGGPGAASGVPEPASLLLLSSVSLVALRRRRAT